MARQREAAVLSNYIHPTTTHGSVSIRDSKSLPKDTQGSSVATLPDILCFKDLSYPICSRRRLLHPLVGIVPPAAFVLSTKSTCKGHCLSSLGAL
ncbi:hypothetical protein GW17_00053307 [Ensete ventricosum]|nr:hypothetical protein GW17_00053307 [Ensete ventricosum]